jgi:preprotein translocase subunit SecG
MESVIFPIVLAFHVLIGLTIIGLVLLQHGKGADMGAAFGSGASGSLFGASGSANFLSRTTAVLAAVFFLTSLGLSYLASNKPDSASRSVMDVRKGEPPAPAAPLEKKSEPLPPPSPAEDSKAKDIPK